MARYDTIAVSAYLSGPGQEKKVAYFERLDAALRVRGMRLVLVNVGPDSFESTVEHVTIPYCVTLANRIPGVRYFAETSLEPGLREAAGIEAAIRNSPLANAAVKVSFYLMYMRAVLRGYRAQGCIIWHQFNGLHSGLARLCAELGVPVIYAEYGSLPGTVVFETGGQMAESWVARQSESFVELPVDATDMDEATQLLARVREEKRSRKEQTASVSIDAIVRAQRERGRKIIFYAGQNDPQTGMVPNTLPNAKLHSPFYEDTEDALRHLVQLAEANNWHVLYKPHPMLEAKQKSVAVNFADRYDVATGADIFECMGKTDVTVTILSQVAYLACIHGHPCVLLGRNQLSGKGCVYEVHARDEAATTLEMALASGTTAAQRERWMRHVAQLCKYYLFSFESDIRDVIGRGEDEAAEYIENALLAAEAIKPEPREAAASSVVPRSLRLRVSFWFLNRFDERLRELARDEFPGSGRIVKGIIRRIVA